MTDKNKYNWYKYKELFSGNISPEQLKITFNKIDRKTNDCVEKAIEQSWYDGIKGRLSVGLEGFYNSIVYRLNSCSKDKNTLHLNIGETTFKELQGTNATNWILGDIYSSEVLANGILVQAIVTTNDNKIILGRRNAQVKKGFETCAIFGGSLEKKYLRNNREEGVIVETSNDIFQMMTQEIIEELGVEKNDISDLSLINLFQDWKYYPVLLFKASLSISKDEILDKFNNNATDEHVGIVFYTLEEILDVVENNPERLSDLTLASLDLYRKNSNN